jgi:hypothetical protein
MKTNKRRWKKAGWGIALLFLLGNFIVYNHAYKFTHFVDNAIPKTKRPEELSLGEKLGTLFFGVQVPKPTNWLLPDTSFETVYIQSDELLEAWSIQVPEEKGTVILFHGYSAAKSSLLSYSEKFNDKGYSTLLVDLRASGGSAGHTTTIGFKEGKDVAEAFAYVSKNRPGGEIILFGQSMGAVSIMKAVDTYDIKPDKIVLECPFGSMLTTTKLRFHAMGLPATPFAELILFYGGLQTGFNAFKHNPTEYAKGIAVPTLLLYGAKDARVSREEIDTIFANLTGEKKLLVFENAEHECYLNDHEADWDQVIDTFLEN